MLQKILNSTLVKKGLLSVCLAIFFLGVNYCIAQDKLQTAQGTIFLGKTTESQSRDLHTPVAGDDPSAIHEVLLAVHVNNVNLNHVALVLETHGQIYVSIQELKLWRFRMPRRSPFIYRHQKYYPLNSFPELRYRLDRLTTTLYVDALPNTFTSTELDIKSKYLAPQKSPWGGFFNYDLLGEKDLENTHYNGLFEGTIFNQYGAGDTTLLVRRDDRESEAIRLNTTWTHDNPGKMSSWRLGDAISGTGIWGDPVLFGGIEYATNFATQPNFIPYPMFDLGGEATLPSIVDLYVNNALVFRHDVQPGPFDVNSIPTVSGAGNVQVVTTDLLGRQQITNVPYYASNELLKPGLHQFSYEMGFIRDDFGTRSFKYGRFAAVGTDRLGISNNLTTEWHAEILGGQQTAGVGANVLCSHFGILTTAIAGSRQGTGYGGLLLLGFNHQGQRLSIGVRAEATTHDFTQLGIQPGKLAPELQSQFFMGIPFANSSSLGLSFVNQINRDKPEANLLTLSYNKSLFKSWYMGISTLTNLGGKNAKAVFFTLTRALGNRTSASINGAAQDGGGYASANINRSLPVGRGWGYNLDAQGGVFQHARGGLGYQNSVGTYTAQAENQGRNVSYRLNVTGGVAVMHGHAFLTRSIDNSFAIVEVPGYPNVGIYSENHLIAKTDKNGYAMIPDILPYAQNKIRIDATQIPMDAELSNTELDAIPYYRSGVLLRFPVRPSHGAVIYVKLMSGKPLPLGSHVKVVGQKKEFPVGYDGEVYLTGLESHNRIQAYWDGGRCSFTLDFPKTKDPIPDLGTFTCLNDV